MVMIQQPIDTNMISSSTTHNSKPASSRYRNKRIISLQNDISFDLQVPDC